MTDPRGRVTGFMIAANYYTAVYLIAGAAVVTLLDLTPGGRILAGLAWVYALPPLLARLILAVQGRPLGEATPGTRVYTTWWLLTQVQMLFNRIPVLEEGLRLIPGAYGLWLNAWGSRVSLLAYWSPGVFVTDRYLLEVGRGAAFGVRCLIAGHLVTRSEAGDYVLIVAPVAIGAASIVGTLVVVGPGCVIHDHSTVPAGRRLVPFTVWKGTRRVPAGETATA